METLLKRLGALLVAVALCVSLLAPQAKAVAVVDDSALVGALILSVMMSVGITITGLDKELADAGQQLVRAISDMANDFAQEVGQTTQDFAGFLGYDSPEALLRDLKFNKTHFDFTPNNNLFIPAAILSGIVQFIRWLLPKLKEQSLDSEFYQFIGGTANSWKLPPYQRAAMKRCMGTSRNWEEQHYVVVRCKPNAMASVSRTAAVYYQLFVADAPFSHAGWEDTLLKLYFPGSQEGGLGYIGNKDFVLNRNSSSFFVYSALPDLGYVALGFNPRIAQTRYYDFLDSFQVPYSVFEAPEFTLTPPSDVSDSLDALLPGDQAGATITIPSTDIEIETDTGTEVIPGLGDEIATPDDLLTGIVDILDQVPSTEDIPTTAAPGDAPSGGGSGPDTPPGGGGETGDPDIDDLDLPKLGVLLTTRFPFCIPWDIGRGIEALTAQPAPPVFSVDFYEPISDRVGGWKGDTTITLDFSQFETIAVITRWVSTVGFCLFLASATKRFIWTA